jgi:hypothetical protein
MAEKASSAAPKEKHGTGGAWKAHGIVYSRALEAEVVATQPDAADAFADHDES